MERDRKSKGVPSVPNNRRYPLQYICLVGCFLPILIHSLILEGILDILTDLLWSCLLIVLKVNISLASENRQREMNGMTFPMMLASVLSSWFSLQSKPNDDVKNLQYMLLATNIVLFCFILWEEMMINSVRNDKISNLSILLDVSNLALHVLAFIIFLNEVMKGLVNSVVFKSSGWLTIVLYSMVPWLRIEWQFRHRILRYLSAYFLAFTLVSIFEKSLILLGGLYFLILYLYAMQNRNMFKQGLQHILDKIINPKSRPEEKLGLGEATFQPNEICVPPLDPQFRNSRIYRDSSDLHFIAKVAKRNKISIEKDTSDEKFVRSINLWTRKEMVRYRRTQNELYNLVNKDTLGSHGSKMVSEIHEIAAELDVSSEGKIAKEGKKNYLSHEADSVSLNIASDEEDYLGDCILYCSQFPADYEFSKDNLVWSWIAAGAIQSDENDKMETIAIRCFDRLIMLEFILPSGHDRLCDQMIYKLGKDKNVLPSNKNQGHKYRKSLESDADLAEIEHLSLISLGINQLNLEILRKCINLKTLLLHKCCGSEIENLLNGIFLKLKLLTLIDLSCTNVVELPSSVENLTALEYLDMSQTPIRFLPESIGSLGNLETLKLLGCRSLFGLPRGICKLIKLQHFEHDIQSMPIGMGNLTNLRTLRKFVVGRKDGNGIGELRNMNKLKGSLRIVKLENILNKEEAGTALLRDKQNLTKLELLWSDLEDDKVTIEEEILENLQPPSGLQELRITFYSGGVLPSWISDPSFNQLFNITLSGCRYCELMPTFGQLPSLKILRVYGMDSVVAIEFSFCRKQNNDHQHAFPRLEKLSFDGMSNLEKWTGVEDGDFPCLVQLVIKDCPKLASLPFPSHWISRTNLEISNCKCLMEKDCPELKSE